MEELLEVAFSIGPRRGYVSSGSGASRELTAEVGGWQLQVSPTRELAAEGNTSWSQLSVYEVGLTWLPICKDVRPEAVEPPSLEAATKQRDWVY
jgi:hypothetical protein